MYGDLQTFQNSQTMSQSSSISQSGWAEVVPLELSHLNENQRNLLTFYRLKRRPRQRGTTCTSSWCNHLGPRRNVLSVQTGCPVSSTVYGRLLDRLHNDKSCPRCGSHENLGCRVGHDSCSRCDAEDEEKRVVTAAAKGKCRLTSERWLHKDFKLPRRVYRAVAALYVDAYGHEAPHDYETYSPPPVVLLISGETAAEERPCAVCGTATARLVSGDWRFWGCEGCTQTWAEFSGNWAYKRIVPKVEEVDWNPVLDVIHDPFGHVVDLKVVSPGPKSSTRRPKSRRSVRTTFVLPDTTGVSLRFEGVQKTARSGKRWRRGIRNHFVTRGVHRHFLDTPRVEDAGFFAAAASVDLEGDEFILPDRAPRPYSLRPGRDFVDAGRHSLVPYKPFAFVGGDKDCWSKLLKVFGRAGPMAPQAKRKFHEVLKFIDNNVAYSGHSGVWRRARASCVNVRTRTLANNWGGLQDDRPLHARTRSSAVAVTGDDSVRGPLGEVVEARPWAAAMLNTSDYGSMTLDVFCRFLDLLADIPNSAYSWYRVELQGGPIMHVAEVVRGFSEDRPATLVDSPLKTVGTVTYKPDMWLQPRDTAALRYWVAQTYSLFQSRYGEPDSGYAFDVDDFEVAGTGTAPELINEAKRMYGPEFARGAAMRSFEADLETVTYTRIKLSDAQVNQFSKYLGKPIASSHFKAVHSDHLELVVARDIARGNLARMWPAEEDTRTVLHVGSTVTELIQYMKRPGHEFLFNLKDDKDSSRVIDEVQRIFSKMVSGTKAPRLTKTVSDGFRYTFSTVEALAKTIELASKSNTKIHFQECPRDRQFGYLMFEDCLYDMTPDELHNYFDITGANVGYATLFVPDEFISEDAIPSRFYDLHHYTSDLDPEKILDAIWPEIALLTPLIPDAIETQVLDAIKNLITHGWKFLSDFVCGVLDSPVPWETAFFAAVDVVKYLEALKKIFKRVKNICKMYFGRVGVTWKNGLSSGYDHNYGVWSYWLRKRRFTKGDFVLDWEVVDTNGEVYTLKFYRSRGKQRIWATNDLPLTRKAVYVMDPFSTINPITKLPTNDPTYIKVPYNDFYTLYNFALGEPIETLDFATMVNHLNRIRRGLSLNSNVLVEPLNIDNHEVKVCAMGVLMEVYKAVNLVNMVEGKKDFMTSYKSNLERFLKILGGTVVTLATGGMIFPAYFLFVWLMKHNSRFEFVRLPKNVKPLKETAARITPSLKNPKAEIKDWTTQSVAVFLPRKKPVESDPCQICRSFRAGRYGKQRVWKTKCTCEMQTLKMSPEDVVQFVNEVRGSIEAHRALGAGQKLLTLMKGFQDYLETLSENGFTHDLEVDFITGGPGTGKSVVIREMMKDYEASGYSTAVTFPFSALKTDYENATLLDGTRKTFIADTLWWSIQRKKVDVLFIDEATAVRHELAICLAKYLGVHRLVVVGDKRQTHLNEATSEGVDLTIKGIDFEKASEHELVYCFRLNRRTIKVLNMRAGYRLLPIDNTPDELSEPRVISPAQFQALEGEKPHALVFSHASGIVCFGVKSDPNAKSNGDPDGADKFSVRGAQGKTYTDVAIGASDIDKATVDVPGMLVVAVSRHRRHLYIVAPRDPNDNVPLKIRQWLYCDSDAAKRQVADYKFPQPPLDDEKTLLTEKDIAIDDFLGRAALSGAFVSNVSSEHSDSDTLVVTPDISDPDAFPSEDEDEIEADYARVVARNWSTCLVDSVVYGMPERLVRRLKYALVHRLNDNLLRSVKTSMGLADTDLPSIPLNVFVRCVEQAGLAVTLYPAEEGVFFLEGEMHTRTTAVNTFGVKLSLRSLDNALTRFHTRRWNDGNRAKHTTVTSAQFVQRRYVKMAPALGLLQDGTVDTVTVHAVPGNAEEYRSLTGPTDMPPESVEGAIAEAVAEDRVVVQLDDTVVGIEEVQRLNEKAFAYARSLVKIGRADLAAGHLRWRLWQLREFRHNRHVNWVSGPLRVALKHLRPGTYLGNETIRKKDFPTEVLYNFRAEVALSQDLFVTTPPPERFEDALTACGIDPDKFYLAKADGSTCTLKSQMDSQESLFGCYNSDNTSEAVTAAESFADQTGSTDHGIAVGKAPSRLERNDEVATYVDMPQVDRRVVEAATRHAAMAGVRCRELLPFRREVLAERRTFIGKNSYRLAHFLDPTTSAAPASRLNYKAPLVSVTSAMDLDLKWSSFISDTTKAGNKRKPDRTRFQAGPGFGNHFSADPVETLLASQRVFKKMDKKPMSAESRAYAHELAREAFHDLWQPDFQLGQEEINGIVAKATRDIKTRQYYNRAKHFSDKGWDFVCTVSNKPQFKPEKKGSFKLMKPGQALLQSPPGVNLEFCTWMRALNAHFRLAAGPELFYESLEPTDVYQQRMTQAINLLPDCVLFGISDAEEFDAQQNESTVEVEKEFTRLQGAVSADIEQYYLVRGRLPARMFGHFSGTTNGAKGSGFLDTLLGNSKLSLCCSRRLFKGSGPKIEAVKGDDYLRVQGALEEDPDEKTRLKAHLNMNFITDIRTAGEFCGNVVNNRGAFTSLKRAALKTLAFKARDYKHWQEYALSVKERVLQMEHAGIDEIIVATVEAEGCSVEYAQACYAFLKSCTKLSKAQFETLYKPVKIDKFHLPAAVGADHMSLWDSSNFLL